MARLFCIKEVVFMEEKIYKTMGSMALQALPSASAY